MTAGIALAEFLVSFMGFLSWRSRRADSPFVECDPNLVRQVFQNLIGNALKYSRPRPRAVIEIGHGTKDGASVIFVKDNGVGFSMKYADKLFGVFQRLHRPEDFEGTGGGWRRCSGLSKSTEARWGWKRNWIGVPCWG